MSSRPLRLTLADALMIAGAVSIVTGLAIWSVPAALVFLGVAAIFFGVAVGASRALVPPDRRSP